MPTPSLAMASAYFVMYPDVMTASASTLEDARSAAGIAAEAGAAKVLLFGSV